jgi:cytochrome P450
MLKYPAVQARAQAELDAVLESGRLPGFSDIARLPYIHALVLETFRWIPAVPMGVPHATTKDDEYRGYSIPKGTIVMTNIQYGNSQL